MRVSVITAPTGDCPLNRRDPHASERTIGTCAAVVKSLQELDHQVTVIEAGPSMLFDIERQEADVLFNIAAGYRRKKDQANIAAVLELSGVPFTGSSSQAHIMGLQKHLAKMVMQTVGVKTPSFGIVFGQQDLNDRLLEGLRLPVIVKPAAEGSSVGITRESVASDRQTALEVASRVLAEFGPPVIVEEFITGREFTVGLIGYPQPRALPVEEIIFNEDGMYSYSVKARDNVTVRCPADIPGDLAATLQDMAVRTSLAIGCRDIARVDIRVSEEGVPYVLEINTLPGLMPGYSELPRIAAKVGINYTELVKSLLDGALSRATEEGVQPHGGAAKASSRS